MLIVLIFYIIQTFMFQRLGMLLDPIPLFFIRQSKEQSIIINNALNNTSNR